MINWTSFLLGAAVMMIIASVFIKYTWKPLVDRSQAIATKALQQSAVSHENLERTHDMMADLVEASFAGSGRKMSAELTEMINLFRADTAGNKEVTDD